MKKALLLVAGLVCAMTALATDYTGQLTVTVNDVVNEMSAKINLVENGGKYNFNLKNFALNAGDGLVIGVGNIELNDLDAVEAYGIKTISLDQDIMITEGDDPNIDQWIGPGISPVPVVLTAKYNNQVLSVNIDITMVALGQIIKVTFVGNTPAGDVNTDGKINVSDVTTLINIILGVI